MFADSCLRILACEVFFANLFFVRRVGWVGIGLVLDWYWIGGFEGIVVAHSATHARLLFTVYGFRV